MNTDQATNISEESCKTIRTLSQLKPGEKGIIIKIHGHGAFRKRVMEMGFVRGREVTMILNAPLQDPIKFSLMGYEISLRRAEAELIEICSTREWDEDENIKRLADRVIRATIQTIHAETKL